MKSRYIVIVSLVAIVAIYVLYHLLFARQKVRAVPIRKGNLVTVVYATGNVSADSTATLRSESGGIVTYVGVQEGTRVRRGEVLLRTDQKDDLLKVEQAKADLKTARIDLQDKDENLKRTQALFASESVTEKALDDAKREDELAGVNLEQSKIALDLANERLSETEVTAPFSGVIISSSAKLGDNLLPNAECFQMISPSSMIVEAEVDEQDFARVRIGQRSVVAFDAFGTRRFDGHVYRIVPKTDEATKTSKVFIKVDNPPPNLNVGMTSTVNIISSELHDVLLVPRTALVQFADSTVVYTVDNGVANQVRVNLGASDGRLAEVLGDELRPGELVITEPGGDLRAGARVQVAD